MVTRRIAVAATMALVPIAVAMWWHVHGASPPAIDPQTLQGLPAELFFLDAAAIAERGNGRVVVVRIDGRVAFVPHHYRDENLSAPLTIEGWVNHLGAPLVFNAGLFDTQRNHLGWLKAHDRWLVRERHASWQGLLLSGPKDAAAWARIADLEHAPSDSIDRYEHAIQSMMLFDDRGALRVRDSDKAASRTVIAEDALGRMLVLHVEGAVTLAALGRWLMQQPLQLVRALNLDGGFEAQLAVSTPSLELALYGQHGTGTTLAAETPGRIRYPLPAVVAVEPR